VDLSKPSTRWAIFAIVVVAIVLAGVGLYASHQPDYACKPPYLSTLDQALVTQQICGSADSQLTYANNGTVLTYPADANTEVLRAARAWWFYAGAGAVVVLGLLGLWAASASRRGHAESQRPDSAGIGSARTAPSSIGAFRVIAN
jgi:hypothetical protein